MPFARQESSDYLETPSSTDIRLADCTADRDSHPALKICRLKFITFFEQLPHLPVAISHNLQYLCTPQPEGLPPSTSARRSSRPRCERIKRAAPRCNRHQRQAPLPMQQARMAESVDALVSNTSGAIRAGSIPASGTLNPRRVTSTRVFCFSDLEIGLIWSRFDSTMHKGEPYFLSI